jgi:hypothetical protein
MATKDTANGLRLARIVSDSVLREKIIPSGALSGRLLRTIAVQTKMVLGEMETEWERNPEGQELREAFHLLQEYMDHLERYCRTGTKTKKRPEGEEVLT